MNIYLTGEPLKKHELDHHIYGISVNEDKEIIFPQEMTFTLFGRDTVAYSIPTSDYKVIVFTDSIGCTSCKLQLSKWKEFINYTDSITQGSTPFLFFFQSKSDKELQLMLRQAGFEQPICIDHQNRFNRANNFPSEMNFQSFLLNKENKVVVIGNPILNPVVKELYLKQLVNGKSEGKSHEACTTLKASATEIELVNVVLGTTTQVEVTVTNQGSNRFLLKGVTTSCECTTTDTDWERLEPNQSGVITIQYKADEVGDFLRTVSIFGNRPNDEPLTVEIMGRTVTN